MLDGRRDLQKAGSPAVEIESVRLQRLRLSSFHLSTAGTNALCLPRPNDGDVLGCEVFATTAHWFRGVVCPKGSVHARDACERLDEGLHVQLCHTTSMVAKPERPHTWPACLGIKFVCPSRLKTFPLLAPRRRK